MKLLLVEDDEHKRQRICEELLTQYPELQVVEARSLHGAEEELDQATFDLVILDMSMPMFDIGVDEDGGSFQATAGQELLRYMKRYRVGTPVVVITQFSSFGKGTDARVLPQLDSELRGDHGASYLGAIYYDPASDDWKSELQRVMSRLGKRGPS
jgi:CheY-like chemotaxis protein